MTTDTKTHTVTLTDDERELLALASIIASNEYRKNAQEEGIDEIISEVRTDIAEQMFALYRRLNETTRGR